MVKKTPRQRKALPKSPSSKLDKIVSALRAPKGATMAQLVTLTGWQPHSVRGAMSGALKKQRGFTITSTKSGDERVYKIGGAR
ncbi:MAG: DUF3489 domain-containing protein [Terricaulis silvestris]